MEWKGREYSGGFPTRGVEFGRTIGTAVEPFCGMPGEEPAEPSTLTVRRIKGVRPAIAVGVREYGGTWLAHGYVIESPRHPLHRTVFRRDTRPNETRGWTCGATFTRRGRIAQEPPYVLRIRIGRARPDFFVDANTSFVGLDRLGVPYLGRGTRVKLTATRCTASGGRSKRVIRSLQRVR